MLISCLLPHKQVENYWTKRELNLNDRSFKHSFHSIPHIFVNMLINVII